MSIIKDLIIDKLPPKAQELLEKYKLEPNAVSYTHLTLPTKRIV